MMGERSGRRRSIRLEYESRLGPDVKATPPSTGKARSDQQPWMMRRWSSCLERGRRRGGGGVLGCCNPGIGPAYGDEFYGISSQVHRKTSMTNVDLSSSLLSADFTRRRSSLGVTSNAELYSDRFIPSRVGSNLDERPQSLRGEEGSGEGGGGGGAGGGNGGDGNTLGTTGTSASDEQQVRQGVGGRNIQQEHQTILNSLLWTEMLGHDRQHRPSSISATCGESSGGDSSSTSSDSPLAYTKGSSSRQPLYQCRPPPIFKFHSSWQSYEERVKASFSAEPLSQCSRDLSSSYRFKRRIPMTPFKVLDAPQLKDDFYLSLVDWSAQNVLAVGLGSSVYTWSAFTSTVTKLCDVGEENCVTSVAWTQRGSYLVVGTNTGDVQLWDATRCQKVRTMSGHKARVGCMHWNGRILATGSKDHSIYLRDARAPEPWISHLRAHRQEVCGLKWSIDGTQLASGGNDNVLYIWNAQAGSPVAEFTDHKAAVKAVDWSPHERGLLASGGGTADRHIRFWNSIRVENKHAVDTGSQVCNLLWSHNVNELVSTHGYSQHQIVVWRYPSMTRVATLTGHTYRVLYLAISPDGQTIVTGTGDETLRFWEVFPSNSKYKYSYKEKATLLLPSVAGIR